MKALIVEPGRVFRRVIGKCMSEAGINPDYAQTGAEAISMAKENTYDLACVALFLDDTTGPDLCIKIRALPNNENMPITMLTTEDSKTVQQNAMMSGITDVFPKNRLHEFSNYLYTLTFRISNESKLSGDVLFVDADVSKAQSIERLTEMGMDVCSVDNGIEALNLTTEKQFDLVIIDVLLAGEVSGMRLVRELRSANSGFEKAPVLALASDTDSARTIELLKSGVSDYLAKPVLVDELEVRARNLIIAKQLHDRVKEQQARLQSLAMTDQLTGLYNRHCLQQISTKYVSDALRHKTPLCLMVIDIDHFKLINDEHGHPIGDIVLFKVAKAIKESTRNEDLAVRYGGEEFLILLKNCELPEAVDKAENLRQRIEYLNPEGIELTSSFGVSILDQSNNQDFSSMLSTADEAVYKAKNEGRNQVVSIDPRKADK